MRSGIYRIRNVINNKCYIGQSRDVHRRIREHIRLLSRGEHHSAKLQEDYDRFGIGAFRFEVLEYCEPHLLNQKEAEYIKKFDAIRKGYNTQFVVHEPVVPVHKPEEVQEIKLKTNKVFLRLSEERVTSISSKQIIANIVHSSIISFLALGYFYRVMPGIIIGIGPSLLVVTSLIIFFVNTNSRRSKDPLKMIHTARINTYAVWYSLFYLVFCIYLMQSNDPIVERFGRFEMHVFIIMTIACLASSLAGISEVLLTVKRDEKLKEMKR